MFVPKSSASAEGVAIRSVRTAILAHAAALTIVAKVGVSSGRARPEGSDLEESRRHGSGRFLRLTGLLQAFDLMAQKGNACANLFERNIVEGLSQLKARYRPLRGKGEKFIVILEHDKSAPLRLRF
jgi:hypothetical protein